MLPTFVIGLREGLEAALIVGIIAAFLGKQGRRDLLRWVLAGVVLAIGICVVAGVALHVASQDLPQKQQEGLETVIGALAVGMVTYMVVWMRRHSRDLKGQLEGLAADAMDGGGSAGRAMVLMAFLAVFREGLETVVFAIAIFDNATVNTTSAGWGLVLGLLLAMALGYGIYRGGVRLNLSKFFRGTGVVLVLVAAGLVVNALHTAHEAGWLNAGQGRTVDLDWLVAPGSVRSSLLTGMLGLQPFPVTIEVVGWLVYLIPVGCYVAWPPGRRVPVRRVGIAGAATAVLAGIAALLCVTLAPSAPADRPALTARTTSGSVDLRVDARTPGSVRVTGRALSGSGASYALAGRGLVQHDGRTAELYTGAVPAGSIDAGLPTTLTLAQVAQLNGGRLPIGLSTVGARSIAATYRSSATVHLWLDTRTDRIVDLVERRTVAATLSTGSVVVPLDQPVRTGTDALTRSARTSAEASATHDAAALDDRASLHHAAAWLLALAVVGLLTALGCALRRRRGAEPSTAGAATVAPQLAKSTS